MLPQITTQSSSRLGPHLVAEQVLLGGLHHAGALPAQLCYDRLKLGCAHGYPIVPRAQALQRYVHRTEGARAPNACTMRAGLLVSGITFTALCMPALLCSRASRPLQHTVAGSGPVLGCKTCCYCLMIRGRTMKQPALQALQPVLQATRDLQPMLVHSSHELPHL